jgi:low temperature requirement protein LtrA
MAPRDTTEEHRASTPLELFFDLCFVVAVATVADRLHHSLVEGQVGHGVVAYLLVFFGIWWAWMNFTWFASAYDTDDVAYRLTTFVQIAGGLVLAAGVPRAFDRTDFLVIFLGYAVMRVGLVTQWLRAAHGDPVGRRTAHRFAIGVSACMVGWGYLVVAPEVVRLPLFVVMAAAEMAVPVWAERAHPTPWHPEHIAERFGLFTLIVLGETVLSASVALQRGFVGGVPSQRLVVIALCGLVIVFGMWWVYFGQHAERFLRSNREGFRWGYGHYLIFSAAAAVGAGLATAVDHESVSEVHVATVVAAAAVTVPVAVFLVCVWLLHVRPQRIRVGGDLLELTFPAAAVLVLASTALQSVPLTLLATAAVVAAVVLKSILVAERAS